MTAYSEKSPVLLIFGKIAATGLALAYPNFGVFTVRNDKGAVSGAFRSTPQNWSRYARTMEDPKCEAGWLYVVQKAGKGHPGAFL